MLKVGEIDRRMMLKTVVIYVLITTTIILALFATMQLSDQNQPDQIPPEGSPIVAVRVPTAPS